MNGRAQWRQAMPDRSRGLLPAADRRRPMPAWLSAAIEWAGIAALLIAAAAIGASWAFVMQAPAHAAAPEQPASP